MDMNPCRLAAPAGIYWFTVFAAKTIISRKTIASTGEAGNDNCRPHLITARSRLKLKATWFDTSRSRIEPGLKVSF
jgi:hypothetical protein